MEEEFWDEHHEEEESEEENYEEAEENHEEEQHHEEKESSPSLKEKSSSSSDQDDSSSSSSEDDSSSENEEDWFWERFVKPYKCYPLSKSSRPNPETYGNKIIMPSSALEDLLNLSIQYPMMFILENPKTGKYSHGGVLEFTSDEGTIIMPDWMMENLALEEGDEIVLYDTFFEKGNYVKLQPHNVAFLELSNPKAVLEILLRNFVCLTSGSTIMLEYNNHKFYIDVLETKPYEGICVIDTDCEVDFATPLDYKEPEIEEKPLELDEENKLSSNVDNNFVPFTGKAQRLDGKPATEMPAASMDASDCSGSSSSSKSQSHGLKSGRLVFGSNSTVQSSKEDEMVKEEEKSKKESQSFHAFSGKSYRLMD